MEAEEELWSEPLATSAVGTSRAVDAEELVDLTGTERDLVEVVDLGEVEGPAPSRLHRPGWRALKRGYDLVASCVLIVLALPLMAVIALAIKLESPGRVLFVHERVRGDGSTFGLLKFRTMVRDADAVLEGHLQADPELLAEWHASFKLRRDPRITRVGRVLRKTSLDELPQLFNILAGSMSLIGPRAITRDEIPRFGAHAATILSVKPGLTGLWAVSGRNDVSQDERSRLEFRYVTQWSPLLDLEILLRTLPAIVHGHGAY